MLVTVERKDVLFEPDASRVIARFLPASEARSIDLINRIMALSQKEQQLLLTQVLRDYSKRHRSISHIFDKHFNNLSLMLEKFNFPSREFTTLEKLLIGSYFYYGVFHRCRSLF